MTVPVPYVTCREGEVVLGAVKFTELHRAFNWRDGFKGERDSRGVMWFPYGTDFSGAPNFSQVNTSRQRYCMETPACQVCGTPMLTDKWIPWLTTIAPDDGLPKFDNMERFETYDPPTCRPCQDTARRYCPAIERRGGGVSLEVRSYRIVGVKGSRYKSVASGMPVEEVVYFSDPTARLKLRFMLGKQLLVDIERYRVVDP